MLQLRDTRYNDIRLIFKEANHSYTDTLGKSATVIISPSLGKMYLIASLNL